MCMVCVCVCVCVYVCVREREREREREEWAKKREETEKEESLEEFKMQYGHYGHMTRNTCDYDHSIQYRWQEFLLHTTLQ